MAAILMYLTKGSESKLFCSGAPIWQLWRYKQTLHQYGSCLGYKQTCLLKKNDCNLLRKCLSSQRYKIMLYTWRFVPCCFVEQWAYWIVRSLLLADTFLKQHGHLGTRLRGRASLIQILCCVGPFTVSIRGFSQYPVEL